MWNLVTSRVSRGPATTTATAVGAASRVAAVYVLEDGVRVVECLLIV